MRKWVAGSVENLAALSELGGECGELACECQTPSISESGADRVFPLASSTADLVLVPEQAEEEEGVVEASEPRDDPQV